MALILEYPFIMVVFVVFIVIATTLVYFYLHRLPTNTNSPPIDVRYACSDYNNTAINFDEFKTLVYGFLTDQCEFFNGTLSDRVTLDDLKSIAGGINSSTNVIQLTTCQLPTFNAHNLYYCCNSSLETNEIINISRKEIKNSDVLICEAG